MAPLTGQDIRDLFQALIDGELAARAAAKAGDVSELEALHHELFAARNDRAKQEDSNHAFRREINLMAGSRKFVWLLGLVTRYVPRQFYSAIQGWPQATMNDHSVLIEANQAHDPETSRTEMQQHIVLSGELLASYFDARIAAAGSVPEDTAAGSRDATRPRSFPAHGLEGTLGVVSLQVGDTGLMWRNKRTHGCCVVLVESKHSIQGVLVSHSNANLTPAGRLKLARCVVDGHLPLRRAAECFNVSVPTAARWAKRYVELGEAGMLDRPSRPLSCPHRSSVRTEHRVVGLRTSKRWGPARIAYHLGLNISTVHRILCPYHCAPLRAAALHGPLRRAAEIRQERAPRYEYARPGEMIHVDVKKLGRIPDDGGHWGLGRVAGEAHARARNLAEGARRTGACSVVSRSSTMPSMTTPATSTQRSAPMTPRKPPPVSCVTRSPRSQPTG